MSKIIQSAVIHMHQLEDKRMMKRKTYEWKKHAQKHKHWWSVGGQTSWKKKNQIKNGGVDIQIQGLDNK